MVDDKVVAWIEKWEERGFNRVQLEEMLLQKGYTPDIISEAMSKARKPEHNMTNNPPTNLRTTLIVVSVILILILVISLIAGLYYYYTTRGSDDDFDIDPIDFSYSNNNYLEYLYYDSMCSMTSSTCLLSSG